MVHVEFTVTRRHVIIVTGLLLAILLLVPGVSWASHQFSDVPDSDWAHDDIGWLADSGLTNGCGPSVYCPDDPVTRRQMAAFSHRMSDELIPFTIAGIQDHYVMILDPEGDPVGLGHQSFTTPTDADMTLNAFADLGMEGPSTGKATVWIWLQIDDDTCSEPGNLKVGAHASMNPDLYNASPALAEVHRIKAGTHSVILCGMTSGETVYVVPSGFTGVVSPNPLNSVAGPPAPE